MSGPDRNDLVLVAEDDDDDYLLTEKAFQRAGYAGRLKRVQDGVELLRFLRSTAVDERPLLLLLDLNMPRKDGREALREIKGSQSFRRIPVVVLTTSGSDSDVAAAYDLGANTFIKKPAAFEEFVDCLEGLKRYWFEIAELPRRADQEAK